MSRRLEGIDLLRGLMLVLIAVNHSPFPGVRRWTEESFGFVSAAEGFVFLAAFLAGMLFERRMRRGGFAAALAATRARATKLYRAHLGMIAFVFLLARFSYVQLEGLNPTIAPLRHQPVESAFAAFLLLFQPALLDILPMYVVFSVLTPLVFWAAVRLGWGAAMAASSVAWWFSHLQLKEWLFAPERDLAFINPGAFDLFGWQLIWIAGLWFGSRRERGECLPHFGTLARGVIVAAAAFLFLARHEFSPFQSFIDERSSWTLDKWQLGPLRLLNFALLAWAVAGLMPLVERAAGVVRPLVWMGRQSLPVFCVQVALSVVLDGAAPGLPDAWWVAPLCLGGQIGVGVILARWLERRDRRSVQRAGEVQPEEKRVHQPQHKCRSEAGPAAAPD